MYSESSKQCQEQFKKNKISGCLWIGRVAQMVKRLPTMRETWVWPLGREDPLEKEMTTHSSTLVWKIPWTEEPGRLQSTGLQRVGHNWATSFSLFFFPHESPPRSTSPDMVTWSLLFPFHLTPCGSFSPGVWQFSVKVVLYVDALLISLWERLISMSSYFTILISSPKCNVYTKMHRSWVKFDIICQLWPYDQHPRQDVELLNYSQNFLVPLSVWFASLWPGNHFLVCCMLHKWNI